jgi:tetratricopeptide (TPR) repeat protein
MRPRWITLVPVTLLAAAGCLKHETFDPSVQKPSALFTSTEAKKPAEGPKRQPKAETCAAYGATVEQSADKAKDPASRAQLYKQARVAYQQALDIDAKNRVALLGMARLQTKEGNHQKAAEFFNVALKTYPQDAELWHELGMCWARQKQWDQAIPCLNRAVRFDPGNPTFSNDYGWTLARAGYQRESFEHFCRTVGEAQANYNLARMSMHLGNPELGRQYAEAALRIDPQFEAAQQLLAQLNGTADADVQGASFETPQQQ